MKLPQIEKDVPIPKQDGRGMYQRKPSDILALLLKMESGDSFVCNRALLQRVRNCSYHHCLHIVMRKVGPNKFRVWST